MKVKMYPSLLNNTLILFAVVCEFWCAILFDLGNRCNKIAALLLNLMPSLKNHDLHPFFNF